MYQIENEYAEFWIEDGILFFIYKQDLHIDLAMAKKIVRARLELQDGVAYPAFCDFRGVISTTNDARDYFADKGSALIKAVALLVDSPKPKIVDFYKSLNRPKISTKVFVDKERAIDYLKSLSDKAA